MFQNHYLKNCKFRYTRPRQELSGWLYQVSIKLGIRKRKKRFVKLNGHRFTVLDSENGEEKQDVYLKEGKVEKGEAENELILTVKTKSIILAAETLDDYKKWFSAFSYVFVKLEDFYELGAQIGVGAFSVVKSGHSKSDGTKVAVKVVENNSDHEFLTKREIRILAQVEHPNIVRTYDVFEARKETFFIMEFMEGGQLYDVIAEAETFTEQISREVLRDILRGVKYLHSQGIVHRDIKPENLLCVRKAVPPPVKIADFGLSNYLGSDRGDLLKSFCGTANYLAPEMLSGNPYGPSVDMWAFAGTAQSYLNAVKSGPDFRGAAWDGISPDARDLIRRLLTLDPKQRLTADFALQHPFFMSSRLSSRGIEMSRRSRLHSSKRLSVNQALLKSASHNAAGTVTR